MSLLKGRLATAARRLANALEFFPLTILYLLINAARKRREVVEAGSAADPRSMMVWLSRILRSRRTGPVDVSLQLPRDGTGPRLPDAFSAALTFPRVRSIALSWEAQAIAGDAGGPVESVQPGDFHLPLAAVRDAQTLLKRYAGPDYVVCLNFPGELGTIANARPDVRFFQLDPALGFSLHERMALVQAADAYIGVDDELGGTARLCGRPAMMLEGSPPAKEELADFLAGAMPARSNTSSGS